MFRILPVFILLLFFDFSALSQTYGSSSASTFNSPNSEVIGRVNFGSLPYGIQDINNPSLNGILNSTCTGYSDFTIGNNSNLDGNLTNAQFSTGVVKSQTYFLEVVGSFCSSNFSNSGNPNRAIKVFVDFNDDGDFTDGGEQVYVSNVTDGFQQVDEPVFNTSFVIPLNAVVGELRMRIVYRRVGTSTFIWGLPNSGSTGTYPRGETEDYTANLGILSVEDLSISNAEFTVVSLANNQFDITLTTEFDGLASITIYNVLGQTLAYNNLEKQGNNYVYRLDMSYADAGVYLIKMGDNASKTYKTSKIIVR
mgnify:CR=1 FL=1